MISPCGTEYGINVQTPRGMDRGTRAKPARNLLNGELQAETARGSANLSAAATPCKIMSIT
jgi:hypothetical protein